MLLESWKCTVSQKLFYLCSREGQFYFQLSWYLLKIGFLSQSRNKVSLRSLSVVLRQLQTTSAEEKKKFYYDGLELAKEALQLDTTDSESWLILGNSYLSLTFYSSHNSGCLQKALAAYRQSEKYEPLQKNFNSADLFYNKASVLMLLISQQLFDNKCFICRLWYSMKSTKKELITWIVVSS